MAVYDDWQGGNSFTSADEDLVAQAINGSGWLQPCQLATIGTETFTISSGNVTQISGATLDGQSVIVGYRILVKDAPASTGTGSTLSLEPGNGVYEVTAVSSNVSLTRVYEMSNGAPIAYPPMGLVVSVQGGTANGGQLFNIVSPTAPTVFTYGTNSMQWRPVGYQAGTGLVVSGSTIALSSTAQINLGLAATSLQSASGVLTTLSSDVRVNSMSTGQIIAGASGTATVVTLGGDVAIDGSGVVTIQTGAVTLAKMASLAAHSLLGNVSGLSAVPAAIPVSSSVSSGAVALRDTNGNLLANSFVPSVTTTVTAGGTTTLTVASTEVQQFTGTATQTCVMPDATTLLIGQQYLVANRSSAILTLNANGGSTLQAMVAGSQTVLTLIANGAAAGTWDVDYTISGLTGTVTAVSVASANGFAGTSSGGATPALTLTTTVTGVLKGNGTAIVAATSGTDYAPPTTGSSILKANGSGGFSSATSGTDYAPATSGGSALKGNGSGGFAAATLNDVGAPTANYAMGGTYTFTGLPTPTTSDQPAPKGYVDALFQGASGKYSAEAATVGTETFTVVSGSVTQISGTSVDGISPNVGDYVLVKDAPAASGTGSPNSTQPGNGLYQVTANSSNLNLTRATALSGSNSPVGAYVFVASGTANGSSGWIVTTPSTTAAFTYGSNSIAWTQFTGAGEITPGVGLAKSGNVLSIENSGVLTVAHGGTGAASLTGLVKGNGTSAFSAATSGTDYAPATTGSSILKASFGGFANAVSGTDYAPSTSGTSILKANGSGGFSNAASGTDYAPATSGTSVLKGNGSGGFASASFSDLATPTSSFSMGGYGITNEANPVNAQDVATKIYADSVAYHPWCRYATTGVETFTISGGTVTQISGTTLDGLSPSVNDRILIKDAPATSGTGVVLSSQSGNGIYVVTGNTTNLTVARAADMSSGGAMTSPMGSAVIVLNGSANAWTSWKVAQTSSSFTYGTNAIQWVPDIGTGNVLTRTNNTISVSAMSTGQAIIGNAGTPTITTLSGDVTVGATGTTTIGAGVVTLAKHANLAANSVIGNTSGSSATPAAVALTSAATAGAAALRDSNANLAANSVIEAMATTVTAAGTTTLTVASAPFQQFTGTSTQTVVLPNATTLTNGQVYTIANRSTGAVTVETFGGSTLQAVSGGAEAIFTLISNSGSAGTWDITGNIVPVYTANVGDGSSTSYTITHNLGSRGVSIEVYDASTYQTINCDKFRTTTNTATLTFGTAPSVNAYVVVIIGGSSGAASVTSTSITDSTVTGRSLITAANALAVQNVVFGFTSTATAAGTTTLTVSSAPIQCFTGTSTQTVVLPTTSILAGMQFSIINESTAAVTVESSNAATLIVLAPSASAIITALVTTPTTPANWSAFLMSSPSVYTQTIGNGSSTTFTITHNLGTRSLSVVTYDASTFKRIWCDAAFATTNTVTLAFQSAPASNGVVVVIQGGTLTSTGVAMANITDATTTGRSLLGASSAANALAVMTPLQSAAKAIVTTAETTTSTTYTDLATTTDTVTVTVGASGLVMVFVQAMMSSNGNNYSYVSFALSGANTLAAADINCIENVEASSGWISQLSGAFLLPGLTAGSTTFKMKYKAGAGTSTFNNRAISVIPL